LKFKENNLQQFTSMCNVNHRKYMTLQSAVQTEKYGRGYLAAEISPMVVIM
jgi:hypothetical protein